MTMQRPQRQVRRLKTQLTSDARADTVVVSLVVVVAADACEFNADVVADVAGVLVVAKVFVVAVLSFVVLCGKGALSMPVYLPVWRSAFFLCQTVSISARIL